MHIKEYFINKINFIDVGNLLLKDWENKHNKVFLLRSKLTKKKIRDFYENFCKIFGKLYFLAEDATIKKRENQRVNKIWMEVRYDPKIPNAYRHSSAAQPLHTDGSYIPNFPNATLMCCIANSDKGGETIFIDSSKIIESLKKENKKLLDKILNKKITHERSGDKKTSKIIYENKKTKQHFINWNYYCVSKENSKEKLKIVEEFFNFLKKSKLIKKNINQIKLKSGDAVIWKDHELLHGRNSFSAKNSSERFIWKCAVNIGK